MTSDKKFQFKLCKDSFYYGEANNGNRNGKGLNVKTNGKTY